MTHRLQFPLSVEWQIANTLGINGRTTMVAMIPVMYFWSFHFLFQEVRKYGWFVFSKKNVVLLLKMNQVLPTVKLTKNASPGKGIKQLSRKSIKCAQNATKHLLKHNSMKFFATHKDQCVSETAMTFCKQKQAFQREATELIAHHLCLWNLHDIRLVPAYLVLCLKSSVVGKT